MDVLTHCWFVYAGHNDSSGIRFYYTSNLREYDAGIFAIGEATTSFLVIPPRQESWLSVGYCSKECYKVRPAIHVPSANKDRSVLTGLYHEKEVEKQRSKRHVQSWNLNVNIAKRPAW